MAAPMPRTESPIPQPVLHEAAEWLLRLREGNLDARERNAWQQWLTTSDVHVRAWQRAERLASLLDEVPPAVGAAPLHKARRDVQGRRAVLSALVGVMLGAPLARLAWQREPWQYMQADLVTAIGEQRQSRLVDGSALWLNTDTRVALGFDEQQRQLRLLRGELLVNTAVDPQLPARPFVVQLAHARLLALGTRFAVRLWDDHARVAVEEGQVQILPANPALLPQVVAAGQQVLFDAAGLGPVHALQRNALAWAQGTLEADATPLGDLLVELARYRPGIVRCDPLIAGLPVSGLFQLDDTDTALALLQAGFPVRVRYRSRLWVMVEPA